MRYFKQVRVERDAGGGFILGYLVLSGLVRFAAMPFRRGRGRIRVTR